MAQEHLAVVQFVAPDDDGLERQRALAQPRDHRLAAGLDALGDRDLALARQQFHRAHLAQVHADRIVGALGWLLGLLGGESLGFGLDQLVVLGLRVLLELVARSLIFGLGFLGLDHVETHLAESRQDVLDLLRFDLPRGQQRVDLVMGDVAALLGAADQLLDGGVREIEQRAVRRGLGPLLLQHLFLLRRHLGLACHELQPTLSPRGNPGAYAVYSELRTHRSLNKAPSLRRPSQAACSASISQLSAISTKKGLMFRSAGYRRILTRCGSFRYFIALTIL